MATIALTTAICFTAAFSFPIAKITAYSTDASIASDYDYSVPDPGIADWFSLVLNQLSGSFSKYLSDGDPKKIEQLKNYLTQMRDIGDPILSLVKNNYPEDKIAQNIVRSIETYLSAVEKLVNETKHKATEANTKHLPMARLVKILEAIA